MGQVNQILRQTIAGHGSPHHPHQRAGTYNSFLKPVRQAALKMKPFSVLNDGLRSDSLVHPGFERQLPIGEFRTLPQCLGQFFQFQAKPPLAVFDVPGLGARTHPFQVQFLENRRGDPPIVDNPLLGGVTGENQDPELLLPVDSRRRRKHLVSRAADISVKLPGPRFWRFGHGFFTRGLSKRSLANRLVLSRIAGLPIRLPIAIQGIVPRNFCFPVIRDGLLRFPAAFRNPLFRAGWPPGPPGGGIAHAVRKFPLPAVLAGGNLWGAMLEIRFFPWSLRGIRGHRSGFFGGAAFHGCAGRFFAGGGLAILPGGSPGKLRSWSRRSILIPRRETRGRYRARGLYRTCGPVPHRVPHRIPHRVPAGSAAGIGIALGIVRAFGLAGFNAGKGRPIAVPSVFPHPILYRGRFPIPQLVFIGPQRGTAQQQCS